jgi:hypothetical protein
MRFSSIPIFLECPLKIPVIFQIKVVYFKLKKQKRANISCSGDGILFSNWIYHVPYTLKKIYLYGYPILKIK